MSLMFCMSSTAFVEPSTIQEYFANVSVDKIVGPAHQTVRSAAREYVHAKQLALNNFHIEAIKHYRNAGTLDVLSPAPWVGMAISLGAIKQDDTALLVWKEVIARDPSHTDALLILGIDAARMGNKVLGQQYLSRHWTEANPEPIESLLRYAALRSVFDTDEVALGFLEKELGPILDEAGYRLAASAPSAAWLGVIQQLVDLNSTELALLLIQQHIADVKPKELASLLTVLPVLESVSNGDGSLTENIYTEFSVKNKLALSPRWSERISLAEALSLAAQSVSVVGGNVDASVLLYKKSVELDSTNALAINNLAWIVLEEEGPTEYVQQLCATAMSLDAKAPYILDTVGRMQTMLGNTELSLELLTTAIELSDDPSPEMYEHLGDALWNSGERERALAMWETASTILNTEDFRTFAMQDYAALTHSVWGVMVRTPEAMYDFEMSGVLCRLQNKLHAVAQGNEPDFEYTKRLNGAH
ncbi:MAG: tetratricopeptide (TPR) repeat protein [Phycisphaerales bacterium]|jgi:tetratricopeptide (TPR) repeat protein